MSKQQNLIVLHFRLWVIGIQGCTGTILHGNGAYMNTSPISYNGFFWA